MVRQTKTKADSKPSMWAIADWLFAELEDAPSPLEVVLWWELRRIPFNLIVGVYGIFCVLVFFCAIATSGHLQPGEDAVEPIALLAAPILINLLYTLGWLIEVPTRVVIRGLSPRFGPRLFKLGLGFGLFLITLPAAFWVGYRFLQLIGIKV